MKSTLCIILTALMATVVAMPASAKVVKPTPKPVVETYANFEAMRIAKGWPDAAAAAGFPCRNGC